MNVDQQSRSRQRLLSAGLALVVAALPLSGCAGAETDAEHGYEPAKLEAVKGNDDLKRVTFTAEAAERVGLETASVQRSEKHKIVPYAALIYDAEGKTFVYTSPKPLTFIREEIEVDRIDGERVLISQGPPVGTEVVTVGAVEVYGTELEIDASH